MKINQFLEAIKGEKKGFEFGKPWRYNKDSLFAILPILNKSKAKRNYITLSEAKKVKIKDSGSINQVFVTNNDKKPLFVRAGEIFKGQTQERAAVLSRIVMPEETAEIKVVCVHQSKGIFSGAAMDVGGITPSSVERTLYKTSGGGGLGNAQANVWNAAMNYSHTMMASSFVKENLEDTIGDIKADDLAQSMKTFSKSIEKIIKAVPKLDWQTGLVLISVDGVEAIECFDLADSWTAISKAVLNKENETLAKYLEDKDSVFEYKSSKARATARKVLGLDFGQKNLFKDKNGKTVGLEMGDYLGEATIFKNKVIHLALTKKKNT